MTIEVLIKLKLSIKLFKLLGINIKVSNTIDIVAIITKIIINNISVIKVFNYSPPSLYFKVLNLLRHYLLKY